MQVSLYIDREDAKQTEEEEKNLFIKEILLQCGVPLDEVWEEDELTVEQKIELRKLLSKYEIFILDDGDRGMEVYLDNDLIAKWNKPTYKLRQDMKQVDDNKKLYYELILDAWSVFEELEQEKENE